VAAFAVQGPAGRTGLPEVDDEVRELLKHFSFDVSRGPLDQRIDAHTRGDWGL
jgi:hypothetical protein